jgi:GMP synthase (glutamine-hydrolysing)
MMGGMSATVDARPVLVLQHLTSDHPAYLATWLKQAGVPFVVRNAEADEAYPTSMQGFRALAVLGGAMSANDDMPHLRQAEQLIRDAMEQGLPVIGHCLGGQLMARALGGRVFGSLAPEIGWQAVSVLQDPVARPLAEAWFDGVDGWLACHWHHEAFSLPPDARPLATSPACEHQAFIVERHGVQHLAMQFHIEVDAAKLDAWSREQSDAHDQALLQYPTSVMSGAAMREAAKTALPAQQRVADAVYRRWLQQGDRFRG